MISDSELTQHTDDLAALISKVEKDGLVVLSYLCERFGKSMLDAELEWTTRISQLREYIDARALLEVK